MDRFTIESVSRIRDAIDKNKLVVFVGSGVSANSGLPSWKELIEEFAKGVGIDPPYNTEDYLKIPQYYYNARGSKEYYDTLTKIFNIKEKPYPNKIHEILFELNPAHIITTNFDDLLEQTVLRKGVFFDTVKKDEDLPYTPNGKMIIKMHGDLQNKNVVLKEDDYLSYSNRFKLIENYVKALFSTYTVLFVGYSVSDPDVRLIFQWVKDILKEDFQRAYLLKINMNNKDISPTERQYYQNRGINILYYSEIEKNITPKNACNEEPLTANGQKLYKFLHYIKTDNAGAEHSPKNAIEVLYEKLSVLDVLNKVLPDDIRHLLENDARFHFDNNKLETTSPVIVKYIAEIKKRKPSYKTDSELLEKKRVIDQVFLKADISELTRYSATAAPSKMDSYEIKIEHPLKNEDIELLTLFQYKYIKEKLLSSVADGESSTAVLFRKAFYYYKLTDFHSAYKILKRVSTKAWAEKDYLTFFLSESNRQHIGETLKGFWIGRNLSPEKLKIISEEVKMIDLEEIIMRMPQNERKKYFFIKDLINFKLIYKTFYDFIKFQNEIREEEKIQRFTPIETGPIFRLNFNVAQLWEYINLNYIMIEHFSELKALYQHYIESVFISYTAKEHDVDEENNAFLFFGETAKVNKIETIPFLAMYIMISHVDSKTLNKLFEQYKITKIDLKEEDVSKLITGYQNLVGAFLEISLSADFRNILNRMIMVFSRLQLSIADFRIILDGLKTLLVRFPQLYDGVNVREFVYYQITYNRENVDINSIASYLDAYLTKLMSEKTINDYSERALMLNSLSGAINFINAEYCTISPTIKNVIAYVEADVDKLRSVDWAISMYRIASQDLKNEIEKLITSTLDEKFDLNIYAEACCKGIISPTEILENKCIENVELLISKKATTAGNVFPDPVDNALRHLTNLIYSGKYIKLDRYKKFIGNKKIFDFILSPETFDFNEIDLKWLYRLSEAWIEEIIQNEKNKTIIKNKLTEAILLNDEDHRNAKMYFKYFGC